jgi:Protein of unknown function DUF262/Protein of unknown function (DUF1524)
MSSLDRMSIALDGIGHALSDNSLAVPPHQRHYAWEEEHVTDLFGDLAGAIDRGENEYFLGSIVVTQDKQDHLQVVDGQQRLATITILLAAIRDYFYNLGGNERNRAEDIERKYLATRNIRTQETMPKLHLNETDHDFFFKRILTRPDDSARNTIPSKLSHKRLAKAAELAAKHVGHLISATGVPAERLLDWVEYVDAKVRVIWVQVPDHANAFTIFETLNDRGLDLAISDLLKNYLFGRSGNRMEEVSQRWMTMTGALEAAEGESMVVTYIRHLWQSIYGLTREKDLYDNMKKRITSKQHAVDFATQLSENARLYAAILNPDHDVWTKYGPSASGHMAILNQLGMIQIRPLILAVLDKFSPAEVRRSLQLMVSWAVRFLITGGLGSGTLESYYSQRAMEVRNGTVTKAKGLANAMRGVVPTDSQFQAAFAIANVSKSSLARYYLRTLERQVQGTPEPALVPNSNQEVVNLEHILPRNPTPAWGHIDVETAEEYFNRLGNLALMESKPNSMAGNAGFSDKQQYYRDSPFRLTSSLATASTWGPEGINERQNSLAELTVEAWSIKV